ncbi:glutaredoxin 3 [bacterium (Candidatus Blackallbacteria) CG17_big_fil_post_rev_8_21_14_2_50_48_46]|uniref:Glutaredoxin n=1 Tax=bacterium (Candidatus Blackallbacteria) CG17_big_fil_post_rev_8_21_14_2_50_48_46 TaxID=2014261 RepID=A0A2M7G7V5_9BACT|nr:MAG: glutaredoxin 3 [bacterium (Candidatus Blackallbacteria) CG18_big_fil_WC_8_21_14_2_50_49_26]PIW18152.1 MAG: glutaredoxin 3 [bacterium (Candidatus Blackallbacteria) CG17_big_fil_post_rev_8_21_14_2_50_48_46]PIW47013.1 MAG: glutaredoxin 3 [bacterium (Candidatus Blackallbacteria) CG13_big_fil_rev_8_21_14_2_50_49_14]
MAAKVEVYSTTYCPYCRAAERLLTTKGIEFTLHDVTHDPDKRHWLVEATGMTTVPQVFINDQPVGGFTDLQALDRRGQLDPLLQADPAA